MMMTTEQHTEVLTEEQWRIAHTIAQALVNEKTDANELRKAIAYLRSVVQQEDASDRFFNYLGALVRHGNLIAHSGRTQDYYRSLDKTCSAFLKKEKFDGKTLLNILGWTARLTYYYKNSGPIGESSEFTSVPKTSSVEVESERQLEIKRAMQATSVEVGQILDAEITGIKGKAVTYLILGSIKLTVKEPKRFDTLSAGQVVKVQVTQLREDNIPKKIKLIDA